MVAWRLANAIHDLTWYLITQKHILSILKIERLKNNPKINLNADSEVVVVETGNQTEIKYSINNTGGYIRKISKDFYYDIRSGEVKEYNHSATSRKDNKSSIKRTMSNLRKLINTNITDYRKVIFVTLTYKENMTDPKQLYNDVRKFHQKLKIYPMILVIFLRLNVKLVEHSISIICIFSILLLHISLMINYKSFGVRGSLKLNHLKMWMI